MNPREAYFALPVRRLGLAAVAALGSAGALFAESTLVTDSPFAPAGVAVGPANTPAESFELAGSTVQGSDVSVCIFERQKKHSQWIPVGGDVDGIHVISYDVAHDTAVVSISGARRELTMRKSVVASNNPSPVGRLPATGIAQSDSLPAVPIASAPALPATPAVQDQREARMLVSDLLEIGVQQRKAYQDAKLKAAQSTPPAQ